MDAQSQLLPCHVVPFQGNDAPQLVGPATGACTAGAWSVDGRFVYVTSTQGDQTHIWRQRFPDGQPEQVTFGTTQEAGIAMAPDGNSFISSVGTRDSMVWFHDESGDHQIASEGNAFSARFSADGKKLYYLYSTDPKNGSELWALNLIDRKPERLVPGYSTFEYSVSADGKLVAFTKLGGNKPSSVWVAPTDHSSAPRELASSTVDDSPNFLPNGDVLFRSSEAGINSLFRMRADGTERRQVGNAHILDLHGTSPDGRWAVVSLGAHSEQHTLGLYAAPVEGGSPILLCATICNVKWDIHGDSALMEIQGVDGEGTYSLPVQRTTGLPTLPSKLVTKLSDLKSVPGARFLPQMVDSAVSPWFFAFTRTRIRRNLYRIPLQ
jgi:hypothetical protein